MELTQPKRKKTIRDLTGQQFSDLQVLTLAGMASQEAHWCLKRAGKFQLNLGAQGAVNGV